MTSTIIMAGGKIKESPVLNFTKAYYRGIYRETYLWGRYKPMQHIKLNGGEERPMLDFVIEAASGMQHCDEIIVVGEKKRIEAELGNKEYGVPVRYIQQVGSLSENAMEAYRHSEAGQNGEHALFLPCDIPRAHSEDLDEFVDKCLGLQDDYDLMSAAIAKESMPHDSRKVFKRRYAWVIDDSFNVEAPEYFGQNWFNRAVDWFANAYATLRGKEELVDHSWPSRRGFRSANMIYGNIDKVEGFEKTDNIYGIRKLLDIGNVMRVAKAAFPETATYFRGRLTVSRFDDLISRYLGTRYCSVEVTGKDAENDVDSVEDLSELLCEENVHELFEMSERRSIESVMSNSKALSKFMITLSLFGAAFSGFELTNELNGMIQEQQANISNYFNLASNGLLTALWAYVGLKKSKDLFKSN